MGARWLGWDAGGPRGAVLVPGSSGRALGSRGVCRKEASTTVLHCWTGSFLIVPTRRSLSPGPSYVWGGHTPFTTVSAPVCSLAWQCRAAGSLLSPRDPGVAQCTSGGSYHSAVGTRSALSVLLSTLYSVGPVPDLLLPLWPQCLAHSTSLPTDSGTGLLPFEAFSHLFELSFPNLAGSWGGVTCKLTM